LSLHNWNMNGDENPLASTQAYSLQRPAHHLAELFLLGSLLAGCGDGPDVPHPVESRSDSDCLKCHVGKAEAPVGDHNDKSNCVSCHKVKSQGPYPGVMPHAAGNEAECANCHAEGKASAPRTAHISELPCSSCHRDTP
jgi:hypothetical protein